MTLPYEFLAGEKASAHEVNANFGYIMSLLAGSVPGQIVPQGEIVMGPRKTGLLTAQQDVGGSPGNFVQFSWNTTYKKDVSNVWRFARIIEAGNASALRVGTYGLEFYTTSSKSGNLDNAMSDPPFAVRATENSDYLYLKRDWSVQQYDADARNIEDYRLSIVMLETPRAIFADTRVLKGTTVKSAYDYGVPRQAKAILVRMHVTATGASGAGMLIYCYGSTIKKNVSTTARSSGANAATGGYSSAQGSKMSSGTTSTSSDHNRFKGAVAHAPITGTGVGMRTGSYGIVPLGIQANEGKFVVETTANFEQAYVHIVGYLV
jgi:hypothetical protein